jgi:hypothetical protein
MERDDVLFFVKLVILVIALMLAVLFAIGIFATTVESGVCAELKSTDPVHEYQWGFWSGCKVKTPDGYWVNTSDYRYIEAGVDTE